MKRLRIVSTQRLVLQLVIAAVSVVSFVSSCAPLLQVAQNDPATLTADAATVVFSNPAPTPAEDVVVVLYGPATVTSPACAPFSRSWVCPLGTIPADQRGQVGYTGTLTNASASFYRVGSGNRPIYVQLK